MKRTIIRTIFILILLIVIVSINTEVLAWSQVIDSGKDFISEGKKAGEDEKLGVTVTQSGLQNLSGYLYNILLAAGVVIAVIVATILGIQFMVGGAEGQAKVNEMLVPFVVGCIIVFGGFGLWKVAVTIGEKLEGTETIEQKVQDKLDTIDEGVDKDSSKVLQTID